MKNSFKDAKLAFIDTNNINGYIEVESSSFVLNQLEQAIEEPMQLTLLIGDSGVGKSMILKSIYKKLKHQKEIHYIETPFLSEHSFLSMIFFILTGESKSYEINFNVIVETCNNLRGKREIIILLDEAQMYDDLILEQIRLISDTKTIKFVITLHKINDKIILNELHFKTRIWSKIELCSVNKQELVSYIHSKLVNANVSNISNYISNSEFKLIHKYTNGNYRECNKLMFCVFELCEINLINNPLEDYSNIFFRKIIELSALKLGLANA